MNTPAEEDEEVSPTLTTVPEFLRNSCFVFQMQKTCILLYHIYFNISFSPSNHQINLTVLAIRHVYTVTPHMACTLSGVHRPQGEKHNTTGASQFQKHKLMRSLSILSNCRKTDEYFCSRMYEQSQQTDKSKKKKKIDSSHLLREVLFEFCAKVIKPLSVF